MKSLHLSARILFIQEYKYFAKNRNGNWDARRSPLVLLQKPHFFFLLSKWKYDCQRCYSMILGILWTKQSWRQLNTAFLICQGFSIRPDLSIRANINYWRFWSKVFKTYVVIEKLSHGLLNFLNHSLYINPEAESVKKSWFSFEFVFYTGKIPRQSHFCRTLEGHHLLLDFMSILKCTEYYTSCFLTIPLKSEDHLMKRRIGVAYWQFLLLNEGFQ